MTHDDLHFSLDILPARKGDCLLLHYGSRGSPRLMFIDGGPSGVYKPCLKPRIEEIRRARGIAKNDPLVVDALMVSHVDDDHIKGILELTAELRARTGRKALPLRVLDLWHNSFDKLLKTTPEQLASVEASVLASVEGMLGDAELATDEEELARLKVLASISQGHRLRDDADFLGWRVNSAFDAELIMATSDGGVVSLDGPLEVAVAGPMKAEVQALQAKHDAWVRAQKKKGTADVEAAYADRSVPNLASIVLQAKVNDKTMLLTGDARGDKILEGLELANVLVPMKTMHVDVLKVPHHGSANNVEEEFFKRVKATHYVFSGNGEHGNPERETLEMLVEARRSEPFVLHFTYPITDIDDGREANWNKEREKAKRKGKSLRAWSNKRDSLESFLASANIPNSKQRIVESTEGSAHVIDLLEPIKF